MVSEANGLRKAVSRKTPAEVTRLFTDTLQESNVELTDVGIIIP